MRDKDDNLSLVDDGHGCIPVRRATLIDIAHTRASKVTAIRPVSVSCALLATEQLSGLRNGIASRRLIGVRPEKSPSRVPSLEPREQTIDQEASILWLGRDLTFIQMRFGLSTLPDAIASAWSPPDLPRSMTMISALAVCATDATSTGATIAALIDFHTMAPLRFSPMTVPLFTPAGP